MSGDVQPRKRRDKKKKKDEEETTHSYARAPSLTPLDNDDVNIHVHKDSSTGGGICAKFVFFILLSALAVLIGLIITEHRGLTDLDTVEKESRFSQIFEGWIDTTPDDHDDHHGGHAVDDHDDHDEDEHDDAHADEDEHDDHDEEEDHEHEEEEEEHDVEDSAHEEDEEEEQSVQDDEDDEGDEDEEDVSQSQAKTEEDEEEEEEDAQHSDEADADDDEENASEEPASEQDDDDDKEDEVSQEQDNEDDDEQKDEDDDEDRSDGKDGDNDDDDDEVAKSEEQNEEPETGVEDKDDEPDEQADAEESKEAETDDGDEEGDREVENGEEQSIGELEEDSVAKTEVPSDLSRRATIVIPPKVEEVEQVIHSPPSDEEYSDEEEIEEEEIKFHPKIKQDYQSLRRTYERSLTPDSDLDHPSDDEEGVGDREGEEYEDEQGEDEGVDEEEELDDIEIGDEEELDEEEEEEVEDEEVPVEGEDEDDEELMKKLEAKYGRISSAEYEDHEGEYEIEHDGEEEEEDDEDDGFPWQHDNKSGAQEIEDFEEEQSAPSYDFEDITNAEDMLIFEHLDEAQGNININAALALSQFNQILRTHPRSPRAIYGKARVLDNLAEKKQSNQLLTDAITNYMDVMQLQEAPDALLLKAAERCINRLRFMGHYGRAITVHKLLIDKFPNVIDYRNQLAVTYLTTNKISDARELLKSTLSKWPHDGFALVHYGFILKVNDNDLTDSVEYLRQGLATRQPGVIDGRFYFHLGDALVRLGRHQEARQIYHDGVQNGVFLSHHQRSLYNVNSLTGKPWWSKNELPSEYQKFFQLLEKNYLKIQNEGIAVMNQRGFFQDEAENLRDSGDWKQFELYARGAKHKKNCQKCPLTCAIVDSLPDAVNCRRGQIKFSVMHPGTHVWPHCGPTNCRLRVHLGLKVPAGTFIRVADETRSWKDGRVLIFDDSFEHEVWHNGTDFRLVLIVDVWHPELTEREKRSLSAI